MLKRNIIFIPHLFVISCLFTCLIFFTVFCKNDASSTQNDDNSPNNTLKGWELDETNTGLAGVGLNKDDLTSLDLTSGENAGKGSPDYSGVTGYIYIYANQTIENKIIAPAIMLDLTAGGITIKNCLIQPTIKQAGLALINIKNGTIQDCDIDGLLLPDTNGYGTGCSATDSQIIRCNIYGMSTGIQMYGIAADMHIENCYIHDLRYLPGAHIDGITIRQATGTSCSAINNRVVTDVLCTSAIFYSTFYRSNYGICISTGKSS